MASKNFDTELVKKFLQTTSATNFLRLLGSQPPSEEVAAKTSLP